MTQGLERRDFIRGGVLAAGAVATTAALPAQPALAQSNPGAKPMTYEIKPLAFDPKGIKGLSEKLLVSHYENNYGGAVKRLNAITAQLAELDFAKAPVFVINGLKREELIATNSMILHEAYFEALGEAGGGDPTGALAEAIARDFGSFNEFKRRLVRSLCSSLITPEDIAFSRTACASPGSAASPNSCAISI